MCCEKQHPRRDSVSLQCAKRSEERNEKKDNSQRKTLKQKRFTYTTRPPLLGFCMTIQVIRQICVILHSVSQNQQPVYFFLRAARVRARTLSAVPAETLILTDLALTNISSSLQPLHSRKRGLNKNHGNQDLIMVEYVEI